MHRDIERCLRAVRSRDPRFDGWFTVGVLSTGIYCRPSCPALVPREHNLRFYPSAAAAGKGGFRACKRCRPDVVPGSPQWDVRADVTARAMRLIADGVIDREGVTGLSSRLGFSRRQLERHLRAEVGAGPLALARSQRAQTARILIETTSMPMGDVAFAAGFSSLRNFNDTVRSVFDLSPTALRHRARTADNTPLPAALTLRLPFRRPLHAQALMQHLAVTAVPGVESYREGTFRRTLRLPHEHGVVSLRVTDDQVDCRLDLIDLRDVTAAINRCRRLLDLDADPEAVIEGLGADPVFAEPMQAVPGRRVPRAVDGPEMAVRAVLGQQVSTSAAQTLTGRLVRAYGRPIDDPHKELTHRFPTPEELMAVQSDTLAMPATRRHTLIGLVTALANDQIDLGPGADRHEARARLRQVPGIGPWTSEVIAMRALGDPDAFPATDLGVRRAAQRLGLPTTPAALTRHARSWRPWRSYAVSYLWHISQRISADGDRIPARS